MDGGAVTWYGIESTELSSSAPYCTSHVTTPDIECTRTNEYTNSRLTALCPGLPGWAGTRKEKPIWILLKQETVSGSGISWAICKFAHRSRQITTPAPHHSVFYRPDALPAAQPTVSKHWRKIHRKRRATRPLALALIQQNIYTGTYRPSNSTYTVVKRQTFSSSNKIGLHNW